MRNKIEYIQQKELNGLLEQYRQNPKCRILGVNGKRCMSIYELVADFEKNCLFRESAKAISIGLWTGCEILCGMIITNMSFM